MVKAREQSMSEPDFYVDKKLLRRAFEKAAQAYDEAAILQREVASRMLERLDYMLIEPQVVLDAGAGTGYCTLDVVQRYPNAQIIALDIAAAMLEQTRRKTKPGNNISYVTSDIEKIALADNSVDLIVSSLTVQWCNDYIKAFAEFKRVLKPGGCLLFTSFGPDALKELRHCWYKVDSDNHVNSFIDMHHIGDTLFQAGFKDPVMDTETITVAYKDVYQIMRDLKTIGAHNVLNGRRHSLTGKKRLQAMVAEYETFRHEGVLPLSYEIVYGHAWTAPAESVNVDFSV